MVWTTKGWAVQLLQLHLFDNQVGNIDLHHLGLSFPCLTQCDLYCIERLSTRVVS